MGIPQLYTKTSYSLLNSTLTIKEYVEAAKKRGYSAIAITDENVLYGAVEFFQACKAQEILGIIGLELDFALAEETAKLLFYAKDVAGYQELMRLSSERMMAEKPLLLSDYQLQTEKLVIVLPVDGLEDHRDAAIAEVLKETPKEFYLGISPNSDTFDLTTQLPRIPIQQVA